MATTASLLALVETAIEALFEGRPVESYSLPNGANLRYYDREQLFAIRDRLRAEASQNSGPRTIRAVARARTWRG